MPTVASFLYLFRMLCVYYLTKANVEENRMFLLTTYRDCMLEKFKENQKEVKTRKEELKDRLAKGISIINGEVYNIGAYNSYINHVVYDLAGCFILFETKVNRKLQCVHGNNCHKGRRSKGF